MPHEQITRNQEDSLESAEKQERIENPTQEKTPEELRAENVELLTQRAKLFIIEKKAEKRKEEIRQKLQEEHGETESAEEEQKQEISQPKSKGFVANMKDKYRKSLLRMKGVEHPQEMMRLIDYLEEHTPVSKHERVPKDKVERVKKRYLKSGYRLESEYDSFAEGKITLHFTKDGHGYKFEKRDIERLSKLLNTPSDAAETFEELKKIGEVSPYLATMHSDKMAKLLQIPDAPSAIRKLSQMGIDCGYINDQEIEKLVNLLGQNTSETIFSSQTQERLSSLLSASGGKIKIENTSSFLRIAQNDNLVRIVPILIESGLIDKSLHNLGRAQAFQDQELANQLISAYQSGVDPETLGLRDIVWAYESCQYDNNTENEEGYKQQLNHLKEALKSPVLDLMANDESSREAVDNVMTILGRRCSISELEQALSIGKNPQGLALLEFLRETELLQSERSPGSYGSDGKLEKVANILEEKQLMEEVFQPDFQNFVIQTKGILPGKMSLKSLHYLDYRNAYHSPLLEMYKDDYLRNNLPTPEGIALKNYVCQHLPEDTAISSVIDQLKMLLAEPGIINTLKSLESYLGYKYNISSDKDSTAEIINIHHNSEQQKMLFSEQAKNLQEGLWKNFGNKFSPGNVGKFSKILSDESLQRDIFAKENMEFVKEFSGQNAPLSYILRLTKVDSDLRPLLVQLKNSFGHFPEFSWHNDNLEGEDTLRKLLENKDLRNELFSPKRTQLFEEIRKNSNTRYTLSTGEIEPFLKLPINLIAFLQELSSKFSIDYRFRTQDLGIISKIAENKDEYLLLLDKLKNAKVQSDIFNVNELKSVHDLFNYLNPLLGKDFEDIVQRIERNKSTFEISDVFSKSLVGEKIEEGRLEKLGLPELDGMPEKYLEYFNGFREKYALGDKGETITMLVAMRESKKLLEDEGGFSWESMLENTRGELEKYQEMIDKNAFDRIPQGLKVSIGMEYEATKVIKYSYESSNLIGYKNSISKASNLAKIGIGADAIHEISTQPADNPYLMLLEMKLLQDLGYIDFNFRPPETGGYYGAATGYHLSLGGEHGIEANHNAGFLSNVVSMNNWGGAHFEEKVSSVGRIRQRGMDSQNVFLLENQSPSVELRNFSIDRWEPFERAITTCYNSAIAIQATERYTNVDYRHIKSLSESFPSSPEELIELLNQKKLLKEPIGDATSRRLIFMWMKLQSDVMKAIEDHNANFLTNETVGYLDEKSGQWVDSREASGRDNQRYFQEGLRNLNKTREQKIGTMEEFFEKELMIEQDDLFGEPSAKTANAITNIGNLFLTKFSNFSRSDETGGKKKADPNVLSFLTNTREDGVKNERRNAEDVEKSVFDRNGEMPQDYYYLQGGSEKLIIHQTQKLILAFNKDMANLLKSGVSKQEEPAEDLALAA